MMDWKLGKMELRFAELIWEGEPIPSGELVKLCQTQLGWKKSTTYTMLRRLCQRGIFQNQDGVVSALLSRREVEGQQSRAFLQDTFQGSLPRFLAAFTSQVRLTPEEVAQLQEIIRQNGEGGEPHD